MFLAHKTDVKYNEYKVIEQIESKFVLSNNGSINLISNICPHQGSLISSSNGTGKRTCPYHSWTFDISGNPLTSGRTSHYCKNEKPLEKKPVYEINGLLLSKNIDLDLSDIVIPDFSKMSLKEYRVDKVNASFETIMDLFLDVDHIETVHKGVYNQIGLSNINKVIWKYFDQGSIQIVGNPSEPGAIWLSIYPYTMIEWQPGALFVTVSLPKGTTTDVHVFKYSDDEVLWPLNEKVWETAWLQDREQAEKIVTVSNNNLEESKIHFKTWMKNENCKH
jgi:phenylpropionate dioxygenase-like ring-hydroxylating dioxygenase large terminal subunit